MEKACCSGKKTATPRPFSDKLVQYQPLIVITSVSVFAAAALAVSQAVPFMRGVMGMFLALIATLKLFNWRAFAEGFAGYDVLAQCSSRYALAYPVIELTLAWFYLSGFEPVVTNAIMFSIMCIGSVGVIRTIQSGERRQCACVGSGFDLPVGRVTLAENTIMGAMALMALVQQMP
jgi:hypothetical protein